MPVCSFRQPASAFGINYHEFIPSNKQEMAYKGCLDTLYCVNTTSKCERVAKQIFSILFFPLAVYHFFHYLAGKFIILPSSCSLLGNSFSSGYLSLIRSKLVQTPNFSIKRITLEVDGCQIDALIALNERSKNKDRWLVHSLGNAETYEFKCYCNDFFDEIQHFETNGIIFNYPGVGESTGGPSKESMIKAYKTVLQFVEDKDKGLGAKEIIGYGYSIGGGIQGEALESHELKDDIDYLFIKDRSFSSLSDTAFYLVGSIAALFVRILGWDISSKKSSKSLGSKEIIIQSAIPSYPPLNQNSFIFSSVFHSISGEDVVNDGIIHNESSLAKYLLDNQDYDRSKKLFLGVRENHTGNLSYKALAEHTKRIRSA